MPRAKTLLPIAAFAFVLTAASFFVTRPGCGPWPDALCQHGWPFVFYREGGLLGLNEWVITGLSWDLLFWSAIAMVGWQALSRARR